MNNQVIRIGNKYFAYDANGTRMDGDYPTYALASAACNRAKEAIYKARQEKALKAKQKLQEKEAVKIKEKAEELEALRVARTKPKVKDDQTPTDR